MRRQSTDRCTITRSLRDATIAIVVTKEQIDVALA
jgi:hypothetical protein